MKSLRSIFSLGSTLLRDNVILSFSYKYSPGFCFSSLHPKHLLLIVLLFSSPLTIMSGYPPFDTNTKMSSLVSKEHLREHLTHRASVTSVSCSSWLILLSLFINPYLFLSGWTLCILWSQSYWGRLSIYWSIDWSPLIREGFNSDWVK